jgi:uncharacterized protein YlxP (DUF503 family)
MKLALSVPGARSLKDRRRVVHAFRDRVRARISVSIAEVGDLERYQVATLGVALVARDARHCSELMAEVAKEARGLRDAVLLDVATEVVSYGEGGKSVHGGVGDAFEYGPGDLDEDGS